MAEAEVVSPPGVRAMGGGTATPPSVLKTGRNHISNTRCAKDALGPPLKQKLITFLDATEIAFG